MYVRFSAPISYLIAILDDQAAIEMITHPRLQSGKKTHSIKANTRKYALTWPADQVASSLGNRPPKQEFKDS
jgi:hypothetical protein